MSVASMSNDEYDRYLKRSEFRDRVLYWAGGGVALLCLVLVIAL